jgi:hypothetical protein
MLQTVYLGTASLVLVHLTTQVIVYGLCKVPFPRIHVSVG